MLMTGYMDGKYPICQWDTSPSTERASAWDISPMESMADRVRAQLDLMGLDAKEASLKAGRNETYARDLMKKKSKNPRMQHLRDFAEAIGTSAEALMYGPNSLEADAAELLAIYDKMSVIQRRSLTELAKQILSVTSAPEKVSGPPDSAGIAPTAVTDKTSNASKRRRVA